MANFDLKATISAKDEASGVFKKFGTSVADITKGVVLGQAAFAGLKAAAGGLIGVISSSINSFAESQEAVAQLDAVLKSTKGTVGLTSQELQKLATQLQNQTTYSDEAVMGAQNLLLTFTKIGKEVFPEATKTILDMSTALGQDTKSSAIQLGKALNDPIQGVTALRRVGVSFNEQQLEQIKTMQESGNLMGAQKLILQELATEFGGSATAQAETFRGKLEQMNNKIDNMKERIGEAIVNGIQPFINKLSEFLSSEAGQRFLDKATASIDRFFQYINDHKEEIYAFLKNTGQFVVDLTNNIRTLVGWGNKIADFLERISAKRGVEGSKILGGMVSLNKGGFAESIYNMFRAEGGPVSSGKPYIVGERGPEMFVPGQSGTIVPNKSISSSVSVNFYGNINNTSNASLDAIGTRLGRQIQLAQQGI